MEFTHFEEQIFLVTTKIENLDDGEVGTGFFMKKPAGEGREKILLVSNKHVFWGKKDKNVEKIKKNIRVTFHKSNEKGEHSLGDTHSFQFELDRNNDAYFDHPDIDVDVACVNISGLQNLGIPVIYKAVDLDNFFNFARNDIRAGQGVIFVGYPTGFYDVKNFLPILRSGTIASIPSVDFNAKPQILIDAQVFPGSSGSPVFVPINNHYKLLGIISSGLNKDIDFIQIEPTSEAQDKKVVSVPREWIGLGLLFTNETIKAVYDLA